MGVDVGGCGWVCVSNLNCSIPLIFLLVVPKLWSPDSVFFYKDNAIRIAACSTVVILDLDRC